MGRKPNPLILEFFERGPKLTDNSNRYAHTCKACGENFPKGRIDSLTNHLTKKCPAISEAERINACLSLHGISNGSQRGQKGHVKPNGPPVDLPMIQRDWTALETLAEVSRQIDLSEKHDGPQGQQAAGTPGNATVPENAPNSTERFELHEQFTLENPPSTYATPQPREKAAASTSADTQAPPSSGQNVPEADMSTEERLQALLRSASSPSESANLTMAAAATARLNPSLLDPQLLGEDVTSAILPSLEHNPTDDAPAITPVHNSQPWGEITYLAENVPSPNPQTEHTPSPSNLIKGGFKMESQNGGKARHSRARFDATRRKEVQEVRKIGACIRCRILRKTCSKGHPCDTCRKVLSPRIWRSGCVRTKFSEQLDLYLAGVQIVLAQHRINNLKAALRLTNNGVVVEATHFPENDICLTIEVVQCPGPRGAESDEAKLENKHWATENIVMLDNDKEDVPTKVEKYMKDALPEFIRRETSHFMRITLESALQLVQQGDDELLKRSLELWGLVEILDRERQWTILAKTPGEEGESRLIKEDTDQDIFTTICLQLTAAAERKAASTSRSLLTGMQRVLQDSKTKVDFSMFFTTLILLNCVEKSTWAFKAWEQDSLRPMWPLEKQPSNFTQQGYVLADLLRMLLGIRRALPRTMNRERDGILVTEEQDPIIKNYFQTLNLNFAEVQSKQEHPVFSPTDSRSFELLFCSTLLLPARE